MSATSGFRSVARCRATAGAARLHRLADRSAPAAGSPTTQVADLRVEFPRGNDRLEALPTRFVYAADADRHASPAEPAVGHVQHHRSGWTRETGDVVHHDFGDRMVGRGGVRAAPGSTAEDDGYLALFVFDPATASSDFVLLDAAHVDAAPVAVVRLPQRVPQGLHGNWLANG